MIMEFHNGDELEIVNVFGGIESVYIPGTITVHDRDVLTIRIDPDETNISDVSSMFNDINNLKYLYFYTEEMDPSGALVMNRNEAMEGYQILVSCQVESEEVPKMPGKVNKPKFKDMIIIKLAQLTYEEFYGE